MNIIDTPFAVPVAGCVMILGIVVAGIYSDMRGKELRSHERIAMVNRGVPLDEIERMTAKANEQEKKVRDPLRSLASARRTAIILLSVGVGLSIFGALLALIVRQREVLALSAIGVVNMCIGVGFLIDYNMQKRELARFGMEVETEAAIGRSPVR